MTTTHAPHELTRDYTDGYAAGQREATDDRWTATQAAAYVASCPARNAWERGYERAVLDTSK